MSVLPRPDASISFYAMVDATWLGISKKALRGEPVDATFAEVGSLLDFAEKELSQGRLQADLDWAGDIRAARLLHDRQEHWLKYNISLLNSQKQYWTERIRTIEDMYTKLIQEGFKYILALHGGTALACLNALASPKTGAVRAALLIGLFGGAVGIAMLAIGKLTLIHLLAHQSALLNARLSVPRGWITYRAIGKWLDLRPRRRLLKLTDTLIFGSMIWFFLYSFVCFVILATYS